MIEIGPITKIYDEFEEELNNTYDGDYGRISAVSSALFKQLSDYIKLVFRGKESEIKGIYEAIKEDKFPYNKIAMIDVNLAIHCYSDYFVGLLQFAHKISELVDSDDVNESSVLETIKNVKQKDKEFILSLFGGDRNPETSASIDTSMVTVEAFIQLNKNFDEFDLVMRTIASKAQKSDSKKYSKAVTEGLKAYAISVGNYNCRCLCEILKVYNNIIESMESRTPAGGVKETETYKLF